MMYFAFESSGELTKPAEAVLETAFKGDDFRYFSAWNGDMTGEEGSALTLHFNKEDWPDWILRIEYPGFDFARLGGAKGVQGLLSLIAVTLRPYDITVGHSDYYAKKVFNDRPGVGWMLYLPQVLTVKQVPEARALVPVMDRDEKGKNRQIGTIIVSVTDEPFSDDNKEHVKIANDIEIRLVDQDLLPRFLDTQPKR